MSERADASDAEQEASRWIARLESADVTIEDHKRFRKWLAQSPDHRTAYEAVSRTWDRLDALRHLAPLDPPSPEKPNRRLLLLGSAAAAAIVAGAIVLPRILNIRGGRYETGIGERNTITLADGSTVELNASAVLRVNYSEDERRLYLEDGEAFFDVKANPERPFIVETRFGQVRVLGTSFVVRIGQNGARATVLHGTVEGIARGGDAPVVATASQEISFTPAGTTGEPIAAPTLERRVAWRQGMLAFDGETLREATLEISRQTGVKFEFADPSLAELQIGGYVSATDLHGFLQLLESNVSVGHTRQSNGDITLTAVQHQER